ncbi:MAG: tetratricopeptide repeat protein [Acidimicrobiia bacterium]
MIPALISRTSTSTFLLQGGDAPSIEAAGLLAIANKDIAATNYGMALDVLQTALRVDPQYAVASYDIGYVYQLLNRESDAENQYLSTLEIDPRFERALYNLAVLSANAGDVLGAISFYRRAIAADGNDANAHFNLGLLLRQSGQSAEGNAQIQVAVSLSPSLASAAAAQGVPGYAAEHSQEGAPG